MIDGRIKLRHISCFLEVAARAGFGRAAEALNLTQPAVSRAIAELEEILGSVLFDRGRSGAVLTAEGRAFRIHAGAAFVELNRGIDTLRHPTSGTVATLSVGALPTVAARLMPRAVQRALAAGFSGTIAIEAGPNGWLLEELKRGRLDLVLGRLSDPAVMMGLGFEHLYSEPIVFVARPQHPAQTDHPVGLADIIRHPLILPGASSIIRPEIDRLFLLEGIRPPAARIETTDPSFSRTHILSSDAIWVISQGVVASDLEDGTLVRLPLSVSISGGPVGLTTRAGHRPSPEVELFFNAVRDIARSL